MTSTGTAPAWWCIGILICIQIVLGILLWIFTYAANCNLVQLINSDIFVFCVSLAGSIINLCILGVFLRQETEGACELLGIRKPPNTMFLSGSLFCVGWAIIIIILAANNKLGGHSDYQVLFRKSATSKTYLSVSLLLAPFFEEPLFRGFLYRVFRRSYKTSTACVIIVSLALILHMDRAFSSLWIAFSLTLLNVLLCLTWEKSLRIWNCVLIHLIYNSTLLIGWYYLSIK